MMARLLSAEEPSYSIVMLIILEARSARKDVIIIEFDKKQGYVARKLPYPCFGSFKRIC